MKEEAIIFDGLFGCVDVKNQLVSLAGNSGDASVVKKSLWFSIHH
ncbi:MAG: hypothetical protein ACRD8U_08440 [Pyrinomonadaceae bacterium]